MPVQNATVSSSISFIQRDITNGTTVIDNGNMAYNFTYGSGTTSGAVNSIYYTTGTLSSGGTTSFDLFSLNRTMFGSTLNTSMSGGRIKILNIENLSTNSGYDMRLLSTGTSDFASLLGVTGAYIPSESNLLFSNKIGYIIGNSRYVRFQNISNTGITFEMAIIGSL